MSHVAPERWADVAAGRVGSAEAARLAAHADRCDACAAARTRVLGATAALKGLATSAPPKLDWDLVDVRMRWTISRFVRGHELAPAPPPRSYRWPIVAGVAALAAAALAFIGLRDRPRAEAPALEATHAPTDAPAPMPPPPVAPAPAALEGVVVLAQGEVKIDDVALAPATPIAVGAHLASGDGRVVVQFGERSAFALAPTPTSSSSRSTSAASPCRSSRARWTSSSSTAPRSRPSPSSRAGAPSRCAARSSASPSTRRSSTSP